MDRTKDLLANKENQKLNQISRTQLQILTDF